MIRERSLKNAEEEEEEEKKMIRREKNKESERGGEEGKKEKGRNLRSKYQTFQQLIRAENECVNNEKPRLLRIKTRISASLSEQNKLKIDDIAKLHHENPATHVVNA